MNLLSRTALDEFNPQELRVYYSEGFEESGRFDVRWSRKNNYNFHYTERESLDFRYDRHPNYHSPEKHFHAPEDEVGVGHSEGTPVETALPTETAVVPAKRVVKSGSPCLSERVSASRVG